MEFWEALVLAVIVLPVTVLWFVVMFDLISRPDLENWKKVAWVAVILLAPILGSLLYVALRPSELELELARRERDVELSRRMADIERPAT